MKGHILCPLFFFSLGITGTRYNFDVEQLTWALEQNHGKDEQERIQKREERYSSNRPHFILLI
jgi:hypothetical protein